MINRYQKIKEYVTELDIEEITDMVPSVRGNINDFESVTKA